MEEEPEDAAAEAFDQLREEVAQLRVAIEAFPSQLKVRAPDYAPTLGAMAKTLEAIESHPALQFTPQAYGVMIGDMTDAVHRRFENQAQAAISSINSASGDIIRFAGDLRTRDAQRKAVIYAGAGGLIGGVVLWAMVAGPIARALPASWQVPERMAAATLRLDRWTAASRLMQGANPPAWENLLAASKLWQDNDQALEACLRLAERLQKQQTCKVQVGVELGNAGS